MLLEAKRSDRTPKNCFLQVYIAISIHSKGQLMTERKFKVIQGGKNYFWKHQSDRSNKPTRLYKFRSSKPKTTTAVRFAVMLILVPVLTQQLSKQFVVNPIIHYFKGESQLQFLNQDMQE